MADSAFTTQQSASGYYNVPWINLNTQSKPAVTVSLLGSATTGVINAGCDFGPDTPLNGTGPGLTTTDGQHEADLLLTSLGGGLAFLMNGLTLSIVPSAGNVFLQPNQIAGGGADVPSNTVTSGTSYGLDSSAGTEVEYSRGDHSHGTPTPFAMEQLSNFTGSPSTAGEVVSWNGTKWTPALTVTSLTAGSGIVLSSSTGGVTISNSGGGGGVTSLAAGTGISVSSAVGSVTVTNTGVTSEVAGAGISVSSATGAVTVANTGVTGVAAGTGITVSSATGNVTITATGASSPNWSAINGKLPQFTVGAGAGADYATLTAAAAAVPIGAIINVDGSYSAASDTIFRGGITINFGSNTPYNVQISSLNITASASKINGLVINGGDFNTVTLTATSATTSVNISDVSFYDCEVQSSATGGGIRYVSSGSTSGGYVQQINWYGCRFDDLYGGGTFNEIISGTNSAGGYNYFGCKYFTNPVSGSTTWFTFPPGSQMGTYCLFSGLMTTIYASAGGTIVSIPANTSATEVEGLIFDDCYFELHGPTVGVLLGSGTSSVQFNCEFDETNLNINSPGSWQFCNNSNTHWKSGHISGVRVHNSQHTGGSVAVTASVFGTLTANWQPQVDDPLGYLDDTNFNSGSMELLTDFSGTPSASGQAPIWNGTSWSPAAVVNSVTAQDGIFVSSSTGSVTFTGQNLPSVTLGPGATGWNFGPLINSTSTTSGLMEAINYLVGSFGGGVVDVSPTAVYSYSTQIAIPSSIKIRSYMYGQYTYPSAGSPPSYFSFTGSAGVGDTVIVDGGLETSGASGVTLEGMAFIANVAGLNSVVRVTRTRSIYFKECWIQTDTANTVGLQIDGETNASEQGCYQNCHIEGDYALYLVGQGTFPYPINSTLSSVVYSQRANNNVFIDNTYSNGIPGGAVQSIVFVNGSAGRNMFINFYCRTNTTNSGAYQFGINASQAIFIGGEQDAVSGGGLWWITNGGTILATDGLTFTGTGNIQQDSGSLILAGGVIGLQAKHTLASGSFWFDGSCNMSGWIEKQTGGNIYGPAYVPFSTGGVQFGFSSFSSTGGNIHPEQVMPSVTLGPGLSGYNFGPIITSGTTTSGLQEAYNYLLGIGGGIIYVAPSAVYNYSTQITPASNVAVVSGMLGGEGYGPVLDMPGSYFNFTGSSAVGDSVFCTNVNNVSFDKVTFYSSVAGLDNLFHATMTRGLTMRQCCLVTTTTGTSALQLDGSLANSEHNYFENCFFSGDYALELGNTTGSNQQANDTMFVNCAAEGLWNGTSFNVAAGRFVVFGTIDSSGNAGGRYLFYNFYSRGNTGNAGSTATASYQIGVEGATFAFLGGEQDTGDSNTGLWYISGGGGLIHSGGFNYLSTGVVTQKSGSIVFTETEGGGVTHKLSGGTFMFDKTCSMGSYTITQTGGSVYGPEQTPLNSGNALFGLSSYSFSGSGNIYPMNALSTSVTAPVSGTVYQNTYATGVQYNFPVTSSGTVTVNLEWPSGTIQGTPYNAASLAVGTVVTFNVPQNGYYEVTLAGGAVLGTGTATGL
jgi:hypothetical protein